jgi:hypothetical protein
MTLRDESATAALILARHLKAEAMQKIKYIDTWGLKPMTTAPQPELVR